MLAVVLGWISVSDVDMMADNAVIFAIAGLSQFRTAGNCEVPETGPGNHRRSIAQ
jgi:hypothetical protein